MLILKIKEMSKKMMVGTLLVVGAGLVYLYYARKSSKVEPKMANGEDMMYSDGRERRARNRELRRQNRESLRQTMNAVSKVYG